MMFGSGLPSLYIWGLIWLAVVELTDRWNLARICQAPARYGESLPYLLLRECSKEHGASVASKALLQIYLFRANTLLLAAVCAGVLPWAVATHCAFGLWMHTRFDGGDVGSDEIDSLTGQGGVEALANNDYFDRVRQANGLPLLVLLVVHLALHSFIRCAGVLTKMHACWPSALQA